MIFEPDIDDFLLYFNELKKAMERGYRYCYKLGNAVFEIEDIRYEVMRISGWERYIDFEKDPAFYRVYTHFRDFIPMDMTAKEFMEDRLKGKIGLCEDLRHEVA
ncbi:hypothetical protein [Sulfurisphaera ohwakuensis]|uniref:hypothetical protein n=1 Tax=Sulfurisphaera ohwakuensis TaxID=69656 RepID=UPI0036F2C637